MAELLLVKNPLNCLENLDKRDNQQPSTTERSEGSTTMAKASRKKSSEVGDMRTKVCRLCGVEKPISEFYFRKDSGHYRTECKECCRELNSFRNTGWSPEKYEEAYIKQHGRCAICGCKLNSSRYTRFAGDHDHKTGKLRGLLCSNCNTGLGLFKDSIERLDSAKRYLIQYSSSHKDIV